MASTTVTTVIGCACGSFILSPEGLETHFSTCTKLQQKVNSSTFSKVVATRQDVSSTEVDNCVKLVDFYSPAVSVERLSALEVAEMVESRNEKKIKPVFQEEYGEIDEKKEVEHEMQNQNRNLMPFIAPLPPRRSRLRAAQKLRNICGALNEEPIANSKDEFKDDFELCGESESEDDVDVEEYEKAGKVRQAPKRKRATNYLVADHQYIYKCNACPTKFISEKNFEWHMFHIHGDGSKNSEIITCPLCGRMLNKRLVFLSHLKSHENAEALEEAFDLWNKWPEKPHKRSKASKMSLKFSCKYCLIPHTSHYSFLTHMKVEHGDKGRFGKYVCTYCGTSEFDSMKLFLLHIRTTHTKEYYGKTIKWTSSDPLKQEGRPKGQCDICKKMFDVFYLRAHKEKAHHNSKPNYIDHKKGTLLESDGFYNCPLSVCSTRVKNKAMLKNHFILHLQNNPYACPIPGCNVKCDAQCHLNRHIKLHTSVADKTCSKCGVSYSRIDKLKKHICCFDKSGLKLDENGRLRRINSHSRLQRLQMDQVEGYTSSKRRVDINAIIISDPVFIEVCKNNPGFKELILSRNSTSTKGQRPRIYKCANCHARFYERKVLQKHNLLCKDKEVTSDNMNKKTSSTPESEMTGNSSSVATDDDLERVGCPICAKSFDSLMLLENHVQSTHELSKVFRCSTCKILFSTARVKARHIQFCQKRECSSFRCQKCSKRFSTQNLLDNHLEDCEAKTTCSKCGKILVNPQSLARHWLLIHGVKVKPTPRAVPRRIIKKPNKRKKSARNTKNPKIKISPSRRRDKVQETRKPQPDYSIVKIETEPELNIYDSDHNSDQVHENIIKKEPLES